MFASTQGGNPLFKLQSEVKSIQAMRENATEDLSQRERHGRYILIDPGELLEVLWFFFLFNVFAYLFMLFLVNTRNSFHLDIFLMTVLGQYLLMLA